MSDARQRILETADRLFAERGYEAVGINELIEKSEVCKATFYQQFRSKEALCVTWLQQRAEDSGKRAQALLDQDLPPRDKVALQFDALRNGLRDSDFRGCPFSNTATVIPKESEAGEVVREYKTAARLFWHSLALQIRREPSAALALGDALFLLFSGAVTEAQNSKALWPVDSAKAAALALCGNPPDSNA